MSDQEENLLDALEGLLAERRRYEGWISQLEERRAQSPSHVVDRVRGDYQARLDSVTTVLRGRMSDLDASADTLTVRIRDLDEEESHRRDERAETELRALVGEFAPELAQDSMARSDEELSRLSGERSVHAAELMRVNDILALIRPKPAAPPVEKVAEPIADVAAPNVSVADAGQAAAVNRANSVAAADRGAMLAHMDDAASIAETPFESRSPASSIFTDELSSRHQAGGSGAPVPLDSPLADELAFLHSVVDVPDVLPQASRQDSQHSMESRAGGAHGADLLPPPVLTAPSRPATPTASSSVAQRDSFANTTNRGPSLTPGSIPAFLKDMPTEQVKTLKCSECATMNYPTEWYCERCGGELAAM
ncbi:MAG: hypothetical protein ABIT38_01210 [Gemmatimonadaceae bacterium]